MDIFPLLDELQILARNGLNYADNPYDEERYTRILDLACDYYSRTLNLPTEKVKSLLAGELGHITPKVGADAAIFDAEGRILLMKRADDGCWCLPCGWVEPNESPQETAIREAREEAGLEIEIVQLVDVFTRKPSLANGPHTAIAVVYLCQIVGGALRLSHEGTELAYHYIDRVNKWHKLHQSYAQSAYTVWQSRQPDIKAVADPLLTQV